LRVSIIDNDKKQEDMMTNLCAQRRSQAESCSLGFSLPSYPKVLDSIDKEIRKEQADICKVAQLIATDPRLSELALRIINSSMYGLSNKVSSIQHAATLLGIDKLKTVMLTPALKIALGSQNNLSEYLWERSALVALCCKKLAGLVHNVNPDHAYTTGLFHNCGCLILNKARDDYETLFKQSSTVAKPIYELESDQYGMTHVAVGYQLAQKWSLPEVVTSSVLLQHESDFPLICDAQIRALVAILVLSNEVTDTLMSEVNEDHYWGFDQYHQTALNELMFEEDYFQDMCGDIKNDLRDELEELQII
jgi:HD-like signal output (HDOD) protein